MTIKEYQLEHRLRMFIFEIHSPPKPQKQTQMGRGRWYDPSKLTKKQIQWQISPHAPKELLQGPVEMHLTFYMPIPKSARGAKRLAMINNVIKHSIRPDLSNMQYLIENALTGIVYLDDSQICRVCHEKRYGEEPKTVIKVFEV